MNLSKENLILTEIRSNRYRVSYEWDELNLSCEGLIDIDKDVTISGNNIDEPMFSDVTFNGIDWIKIQVWDSDGIEIITDTELGQEFIKELEFLIENALI